MKKIIISSFIFVMASVGVVHANDIYITQAGDTLDLDITQDGTDNKIGTSTADAVINGDDMNFDITQTGSTNAIVATIKGATYTGTWVFTGDDNTVDLDCSSSSAGSCDTVTLNIATTGDDNAYTFDIGESADSDGAVVNFTTTGDHNIIASTINGKSAALTVVMNNSASTVTTSADSNEGNKITTTQTGDGDIDGHTINLGITGGGGTVDIVQSGIRDNVVDMTIHGDSFDVDISQTD